MLPIALAAAGYSTLPLLVGAAGAPGHDSTTFLGYRAEQHVKVHHPRADKYSVDAAVLSASPLKFADKGGDINVTWTGIDIPNEWDWIAVYCGHETAPSASNILDWTYVSYAAQSGAVTFKNMVNMRCNYYFRYYRDLPDSEYELLAESNEVEPMGGFNVPMHGRLSLTNTHTEMQVTWTSGSQDQSSQYVRYDSNCTDIYDSAADGDTHNWAFTAVNTTAPATYAASDMCGYPATEIAQTYYRHPGYFHTVILDSLDNGAVYCYQYGNDVDGFSEVSYFRTPPKTGADRGISFIAYGDMGVGPNFDGKSTALRVTAELPNVDMLLHFGDISYARGQGFLWEQWHYLIEPISSKIPYLVSVGNHEYDHLTGGKNDPSGADGVGFHPEWGNYGDDSHGECSVPMYHRFYTPQNGHDLYWYSFDFGNVHVIQMSSEHDYTIGAEQYVWMEQDLKSVDRSVTPFVIVTSHRPMYNSENYQNDYEVELHLRENLEPLMNSHMVDLFLAGHYHSYERTCKVLNEVCIDDMRSSDGLVHITIGSAGASLDSAEWMDKSWHVFGDYEFGYLRLNTRNSEMTVQYVRNDDGSVADEVVIPSRF